MKDESGVQFGLCFGPRCFDEEIVDEMTADTTSWQHLTWKDLEGSEWAKDVP